MKIGSKLYAKSEKKQAKMFGVIIQKPYNILLCLTAEPCTIDSIKMYLQRSKGVIF